MESPNFDKIYQELNTALTPKEGSKTPVRSQEIVKLAQKALTLATTQEQKASLGSLLGKISGRIQEKQGKIFSVFSKSLSGLKQIEKKMVLSFTDSLLNDETSQLTNKLTTWVEGAKEDKALQQKRQKIKDQVLHCIENRSSKLDLSSLDTNDVSIIQDITSHSNFSKVQATDLHLNEEQVNALGSLLAQIRKTYGKIPATFSKLKEIEDQIATKKLKEWAEKAPNSALKRFRQEFADRFFLPWLKEPILTLNLSGLPLSDLPDIWNHSSFATLSDLDLSNTQLQEFPPSFTRLSSLKKLNLQGNYSWRDPNWRKEKLPQLPKDCQVLIDEQQPAKAPLRKQKESSFTMNPMHQNQDQGG